MYTELNQGLVECSDSSLSFDRVIGLLNDALRLFAEGNSEQACRCLAEANSVLDSCLPDQEPEAGVIPISASSIPSHSVASEIENVLATA